MRSVIDTVKTTNLIRNVHSIQGPLQSLNILNSLCCQYSLFDGGEKAEILTRNHGCLSATPACIYNVTIVFVEKGLLLVRLAKIIDFLSDCLHSFPVCFAGRWMLLYPLSTTIRLWYRHAQSSALLYFG
jgi:hypothetical protein